MLRCPLLTSRQPSCSPLCALCRCAGMAMASHWSALQHWSTFSINISVPSQIKSIYQSWARVIFLAPRHASPRHVVLSTFHHSVFFYIFFRVVAISRHASFFFKRIITNFVLVINFQLFKSVLTPIRAHGPLSTLLAVKLTPPHPTILLQPAAVKLTPPYPAVV